MTRSTNFEFMRDKCAELADEGAEIEGLVHRAGPQAINLLCAFGEKLLQLFVLENGGSVNRADSSVDGETIEFGQILRQCENKSLRWHVPEPQRILLKRLLSEGNKAKHRLNARHRSNALSLVQDAWAAAGWVWKQLQWGNAAEQFVEPPKGGAEVDDARKQKFETLNLLGEFKRQNSEAEKRADDADRRAAEAERSCDVSGWICKDERNLSAPANFAGREFVFRKIEKFLANLDCRVLLIQGQPGRGKTAIIQKFVSKEIPSGITQFVYCFKDQSSQGEPKRWVRHLYASLVERWQLTPPNRSIQQADLQDLVQQLRNRINEVAEKHPEERLRFVIDAVDESGSAEKAVVAFLQTEFPSTVQVIVTARPHHVSLSSSHTDGQSMFQLLDLDDPDSRHKHHADVRKVVEETMPSLEPYAIDKVVQLSDGNFLFSLLICQELRDVPKVAIANCLREIHLLKRGESNFANELYKRSWQRLERFVDLGTVEKVATLLANARVPLSERIIRDTLGLRQRADWVKVQQQFGEYLEESERLPPFTNAESDATGSGKSKDEPEPVPVFSLYNPTFADFVRQHLKDDLAESNSQLANYCREQLKKPKPSYEYAYALHFLPAHLMRAAEHDPRRWNEVEELLTDIFFLEAKSLAGFVSELATDFSTASQTMPSDRLVRPILLLLGEAIRRGAHFIAEHSVDYPQGLFQCVWNLAWWYGNPEAEQYYQQEDKTGLRKKKGAKVESPVRSGQRGVGVAMVQLLERWRIAKESVDPGFHWLRSRRPPVAPLGGSQLAIIPANRGGGEWVDCTADGKLIAGGDGTSLRIWNANTLVEIDRMPEWKGQQFPLQAAALSPDGNLLIVACVRSSLTVGKVTNRKSRPLMAAWHTRSREVQTFAHRHKDGITDIAFSPDGSRFATASSDTTIRVWDAKSFEEIKVLRGSESQVESICWSPDGRRIVAGADAIRIWDVTSGREISPFQFDWARKSGLQVCYSPDGTRIAASLDWLTVFILDAETGDILVRTAQPVDVVACICFSPDGKRVVYAEEGGPIVVSDARTGATCCQLLGHDVFEWHTTTVCYLPDGKRIASGSSDGTIRIWAVDNEAPAANLAGVVAEETEHIAFIDAGKRILSVSTERLCIWDGQSGIRLKEFESAGERSPYPKYARSCAQFWPSLNEEPASLRVWEPWTGEDVWKRQWKDRLSCSFDLSPDGKRIGVTEMMRGNKYVVRIFDVSHGKELVKLKGHDDEINDVRFSTNGVQIATASSDHTARVWDAATGESLIRIHHEAAVRKVWFSPDGTQIVTFSDEDVLRVFDADGGIEYFVLEQNVQNINDVYFSPDGTRIAVAASVGIFIWDAKTGKLLEAIPGHGDIQAIAAEVEGMSFRLLDQGGETVIETPSGQIVARYPHAGWSLIASHPDGCTWAGVLGDYFAMLHLEGRKNL